MARGYTGHVAREPPADAELVDGLVGWVAAPGLPGEGGQAGQQHRARVYPQEAVVAPRAEHEVAVRLRRHCTVLFCTALHRTVYLEVDVPRLADDVHPGGRQQRHGGGGALQAERVASWRPHRLRAQGLPGRGYEPSH